MVLLKDLKTEQLEKVNEHAELLKKEKDEKIKNDIEDKFVYWFITVSAAIGCIVIVLAMCMLFNFIMESIFELFGI